MSDPSQALGWYVCSVTIHDDQRLESLRSEIIGITAWKVELPLNEGTFTWSGGVLHSFDSTVVRIETSDGVTGWGEVSPLGSAYLPAYAEGARTGIAHLAPYLLSVPATDLKTVNQRMDQVLRGHPYAKSAIDMACWDILGRVAGVPVSTLMGGLSGESIPLYRAISSDAPGAMAESASRYQAEGYRRFQLKIGGSPEEDVARVEEVVDLLNPGSTLIADANRGWLPHEAMRVVRALEQLDVYLEQPCETYEECLSVRRRTNLPFVLDESIDGLSALLRGHVDDAMDMINIKISKLGGLSKALLVRDVCESLGIAMILEDSCGGDVATAAVAHLAHSTREHLRFASTDLNGYVSRTIGTGAPVRQGGKMIASSGPGLGVTVAVEELGEPVVEVRDAS
jgi:L-alanine-DL-glutamate epimerase-like enolase superfamily enzyme